jgi:hypothetical protein
MRYASSMPALDAESALPALRRSLTAAPWLWGARRDLTVFGGSALAALAVVALGHVFGFGGGALPDWAFLVFVLGIDVAHVYATLFRTYLDGTELRARPLRYALTPLAAYTVGVALYAAGAMVFWRALAYAALFHFVRQEIGWLRLARAKAKTSRFDAKLDEAALYVSALYPVLVWHAELGARHFSWFVPGDFWALPNASLRFLPVARFAAVAVLGLFVARQIWVALESGVVRALPCLIVGKTALIWYVGIALCNSDFDFTVTNVVAHGVPYFALLWAYASERKADAPRVLGARVASAGLAVFLGVLLCAAAGEEWGWDRFVFHDRAWLFGDGPELARRALVWLVPLLAVPQITHYVFDGKLWRSSETRRLPAQRRALGFADPKRPT